jgi:PAS domain S-box-containing protein
MNPVKLFANPLLRFTAIVAIVVAMIAVSLYVLPVRPTTSALTLLLVDLIIAVSWGLRYAIFFSVLSTLGFSLLLPPIGRFAIGDQGDIVALIVFLSAGIIGSHVSQKAQSEARNATQRRIEAENAQLRFRDLVNSVEGIVWEADAATLRFSFVSGQAERILGYPVERWVSEPTFWKDHLHPEDRDWAAEFCKKAIAECSPHDFEYRMIAADGRVLWFRDLVTVTMEGGHPTQAHGVMIDITRQKQSQEALRQQANLLNLVHDTIFVRDGNDAITFWNQGAEELYGWTAKEAIGRVSHDLMQTIFPVPLAEITAELLHTGRWEGELSHQKADGTRVIVASRWSLHRDKQGRPIAVLETNNDITTRKEAERTLRESEAYLAEAQRLSHTGSWAWTPSAGNFRYWSEECYRVLGFDPREGLLQFEAFFQRIHPDDQAKTRKLLDKAILAKADFELGCRIVHQDGKVRDIHVVGHPVFSSSGEFVEFVGTVIDVTERRQAEKERERLRQLQEDLSHVSRVTTMGELTASLAHEINQPISAAVTNARTCQRWLTRNPPDIEEARNSATRIVRDITRTAEIVSRIRSLFQKSATQRELVDVNDVIQELIVLLHHEAKRYSVSIRTDLASSLPKVMADRVQLQQVLMNLLLNGIEAMKEMNAPGELTIKSCKEDHDELLISVSDSGVGLPSEQADQIFDAFFTTKAQGTGMGLTISRTIIESHGGRLWASPHQGQGTTFYFTLPTPAETLEYSKQQSL